LAQILDTKYQSLEGIGQVKFLTFPSFPLLFIVDQLLFPMFHLGAIPIKISYILFAIWLGNILFSTKKLDREFCKIAGIFLLIIFCSLLGELFVYFKYPQNDFAETAWSITIYLLMIFSFGLSTSDYSFNFKWLYWVFFASIILNFILIFFSSRIPYVAEFYYSQNAADNLGLSDVSDIVNMLRPRGLFGNPNTSMLQVNVAYLFIVIFIRKKLLPRPGIPLTTLLIILPTSLAIVLGSRSELLVTVVYSLVLSYSMFGKKGFFIFGFVGILFLAILIWVSSVISSQSGFAQADMIKYAFERFTKTNEEFLTTEEDDHGLKRPLILWNTAKSRIAQSPIFGSGYNAVLGLDTFPYDYSPRYYHNDWLRVIVTSGIIGLFLFLFFIRYHVLTYDSLLITPFILPALTNTFLLSIPSIMFYFFMIGILYKHKSFFKMNQNLLKQSL
jgi:O-antigen ligase